MNLEIGKTYRDGLGDLWTCTDVNWEYARPYILYRDRDNQYGYYSEGGQYWTHKKNDKDMVEEVVVKHEMSLEDGKYYIDLAGDLWLVTRIAAVNNDDMYPYTGCRVYDNFYVQFSPSGKSWGNPPKYVLVKEEEPHVRYAGLTAPVTEPQSDPELTRLAEKFMLHFLSVRGWVDENDINKLADLAVKTARILQEKLK